MNTKLLMISSALLMAALGVAGTFFPQEILTYSGAGDGGDVVLLVQIAGALYLGFAFLNWTARSNVMGGIYGRPIVMGNLLHFVVVTFALWKAIMAGQHSLGVVAGAIVYSAFAVFFCSLLFIQPRALGRAGEGPGSEPRA